MIFVIKKIHAILFIFALFVSLPLLSAPHFDIKFSIPLNRDRIDFTVTNLEKNLVRCNYFQAKITYFNAENKKQIGVYGVKSSSFLINPNQKISFDIGKKFTQDLRKKIKRAFIFKVDTKVGVSCAILQPLPPTVPTAPTTSSQEIPNPLISGLYENVLKVDMTNVKCKIPQEVKGRNYFMVDSCGDVSSTSSKSTYIYSLKTAERQGPITGAVASYSKDFRYYAVIDFTSRANLSILFLPTNFKIKIYSNDSKSIVKEIQLTSFLMFTVTSFSHNGKYFLLSYLDNGVFRTRIFDLFSGNEVSNFEGFAIQKNEDENVFVFMKFVINNNNLFDENTHISELSVVDIDKNNTLFKINGAFFDGSISADGKIISVAGKNGPVDFYETLSGKKFYSIESTPEVIKSIYLNRSGNRVLIKSLTSHSFYYWDIDTKKSKKIIENNGSFISWSNDSKYFILSNKNYNVIFDVNTGDVVLDMMKLYPNEFRDFVGITYDNSKFVTFSHKNHEIEIRDIVSLKVLKVLKVSYSSVFMTNDGKYMIGIFSDNFMDFSSFDILY